MTGADAQQIGSPQRGTRGPAFGQGAMAGHGLSRLSALNLIDRDLGRLADMLERMALALDRAESAASRI